MRTTGEEVGGKRRRSQQMLEITEHQQRMLLLQMCDDVVDERPCRALTNTKPMGNCRDDKAGITE